MMSKRQTNMEIVAIGDLRHNSRRHDLLPSICTKWIAMCLVFKI